MILTRQERILFIDTETTGFPKKGAAIQEDQARVCQIAMLLCDLEGKSLIEFVCYIKPDGWQVGEEAGKVTGITTDYCHSHGLTQASVMNVFFKLASMSTEIVAHNAAFDYGMMKIEDAYLRSIDKLGSVDPFQKPWTCTMKPNTHITGGKWPRLDEALKHYCDRELGSFAHDAMYDVKACRDIYFAMKKNAR